MTKLPGLDTGVPLTESKTAGATTLAQRGAVVSSHLKEQTRQSWQMLRQAGVTCLVHVDRLVLKIKGKLSPALQQRLSALPPRSLRWLLLGATLIVALLPVVLAVTAVKMSRHRADASVVASAVPSAPVLASAVVAPVPSVQTVVLDENSKDPEVLLALATERLAADKEAEAVSFVVRALTRQPERRNDERVAAVLFRTANSLQRDVSDKTFALLQGTMAGKGAEIQYQIWLDRSVRESTRKRAERWLHSEMFERTAPGAIIIAIRLRQADSCEKKHTLLPTAGKIGGPATLSYLTELENVKGCGMDGSLDCYPCLRKDARLKDALTQIRSRLEAAR
jgi:hypothetical protein